jgi:hypothetical protein
VNGPFKIGDSSLSLNSYSLAIDELFLSAVVVAAAVEEVFNKQLLLPVVVVVVAADALFNKQLLLKAVAVADAVKELVDKQLLLAVDVVTAVDEELFNEPLGKNEVAFDEEGITVQEVVAVEKGSVLSSESSSSDPEVKIL